MVEADERKTYHKKGRCRKYLVQKHKDQEIVESPTGSAIAYFMRCFTPALIDHIFKITNGFFSRHQERNVDFNKQEVQGFISVVILDVYRQSHDK